MSQIQNHGKPESKIWVVIDKPYDNDGNIIFDGNYGFHFHKMWEDAGLPYDQKFITCLKPDKSLLYDDEIALTDMVAQINRYKPPFIITLGATSSGQLLPIIKSYKKPFTPRVESFAGSLLTSNWLNHEHYCICTHSPDTIIGHWDYRDIMVNIDLGRVREEWEYYNLHGRLLPLPSYNITVAPTYEELMEIHFPHLKKAQYVSTDIETIRPRKSSELFNKNPGFIYLLGLADSATSGISFGLWEYNDIQSVRIVKELDNLLSSVPQIGQNYFNFDSNFLEGFGFTLCLSKCQDTLIRHHILWPEAKRCRSRP